jgi:putative nucleotidyltransferase with HDIG domain
MLSGRIGLVGKRRSEDERAALIHQALLIGIGIVFVLTATFMLAFDSIMPGQHADSLRIGSIAPQDFRAPFSLTYESEVLTARARQAAADSVTPFYDSPDPNIARQQISLVRQILDFIENVRSDPFASMAQKIADLNAITALTLDETIIRAILEMDEATWQAVDAEIVLVLERVMRESIRDIDLPLIIDQLPTQVSLRFTQSAAAVVVAVVQDLLRPNRLANPTATEAARQAAIANTPPERRTFERGQTIIRAGARIEAVDYEALQQFGLLNPPDRRAELIARAFFSSTMVLIAASVYICRCQAHLLKNARFLALLAAIFLVMLAGVRLFGADGQIYLYPAAALGVLFVALTAPELAVLGAISLALLIGVMLGDSLEAAALVAFGGGMGALSLRRSERLNSYFFAGVVIALVNAGVVVTFNLNLTSPESGIRLSELILLGVINGFFSALTALAGIYLFTTIFNLPTSLKLFELSQPNQPLLQRLLREAPGTYQHSLQVANMSEQAANAIGANAELTRVAALYHDVGKMLNPAFFVENQADGVNPHEDLNDPYRSADIIIGHVVDGEKLAAQYRIPARIRDFILEHHGTTLVSYFYNLALDQAEDRESVDIDLFTYPGPKPQSRETAVLMLADSCESTVRARKPANKQEIADIVNQIIDARMRDGQLDESGLRLNDIRAIRTTFVDMLQGVFHPRINYPASMQTPARSSALSAEAVSSDSTSTPPSAVHQEAEIGAPARSKAQTAELPAVRAPVKPPSTQGEAGAHGDDDDRPLREVPPLRRTQRIAPVDGKAHDGEKPNA